MKKIPPRFRPFLPALLLLPPVLFLAATCAASADAEGARLRSAPQKRLESYGCDLRTPIASRIREAPAFYLDYLRKMDKDESYRNHALAEGERRLFLEYLALLPEPLRAALDERLVAVYFIDGFAGGGMADYALGPGNEVYSVLVVNPEVLAAPLDDWIKRRDDSSFVRGRDSFTMNDLGKEYRGFLHTLVHEAFHVYDYAHNLTPYVERGLKPLAARKPPAGFVASVWRDYDKPRAACDFPERKRISAYGLGAPLPAERLPAVYASLAATPFVSLHAAQSWAEDAAETFTWFYLSEKFGLDYCVKVTSGGRTAAVFSPLVKEGARRRYEEISRSLATAPSSSAARR